MSEENRENISNLAKKLLLCLEPLDSGLHQAIAAAARLSGGENRAARRTHATVCEDLTITKRIFIWSLFGPKKLMVWTGKGIECVDTSAYTEDWAAQTLREVDAHLAAHSSDVAILSRALSRLTRAGFISEEDAA